MSARQQAQLELCNYVAEELFDEMKTDMECSADSVFQEMLLFFDENDIIVDTTKITEHLNFTLEIFMELVNRHLKTSARGVLKDILIKLEVN